MGHLVRILPSGRVLEAETGENLLTFLRREGLAPSAPCGGQGTCGKCRVLVDGQEVLACRTPITRDVTVILPEKREDQILGVEAARESQTQKSGQYRLAFDIGTTTVVGALVDGQTGAVLATASGKNPQASFGGDVLSRIRAALAGQMEGLTACIRECLASLAGELCAGIDYSQVELVSIVGNSAMQQLFLGILPENLARLPFAPVLTRAETVAAGAYLPMLKNAKLQIVPDISGFVGADTVACLLASGMDRAGETTLLVDIGTNAEMVLRHKDRMIACAAAAGPALEGACISCGMPGQTGAIDHVRWDGKDLSCTVIGGGAAEGICGSGLVDAVAVALDRGQLDSRGRVLTADRTLPLTPKVSLTQEDIRQVQLAKGAIAAGIELMAKEMGISLREISRVLLAGAFGTYMDAASACRIGLLPAELAHRIESIGNAALEGAVCLARDPVLLERAQEIALETEFLELAALPEFAITFARQMRFEDAAAYWCRRALALGFSQAAELEVATLQTREDVRAMCAADKCGAYGKNWTCPPHCGSLEECAAKIRGYSRGILVQTVGKTEKTIDTKAYRRTEEKHLAQFYGLCEDLKKTFPHALCLGSGGCRICPKCAYPEDCRFPEKACASMEGYGLFVTQVCRDNGLAYHYGERTVTYTACILF